MSKAKRASGKRVGLESVINRRLGQQQTTENTEPVITEPTKPQTNRVTESAITKTTESQTAKPTESQASKNTDSVTPYYLRLLRKESRLTSGQFDALTAKARQLNRDRNGGERITENTLIRVAIELLLTRGDDLRGSTEIELMESLGLTPTE